MKKYKIIILSSLVVIIIILGITFLYGKSLKVKRTNYDLLSPELNDIFYLASVCANSHNSQPWTITLDQSHQEIIVELNEARTLKVVDPYYREAYISIGCYLANLEKCFIAYGYDLTIDINTNSIKAHYQKISNTINHNLLTTINKRHTNKQVYKTDVINESIKEILESKYRNLKIYQRGEKNYSYLTKISLDAIIVQSSDQSYRDELNKWMRFSDKEALIKRDGITAEMIGLKGIVKTFYYWTTNHQNASGDTFAQQGIDTATKQLANCGAIAILWSDSDSVSLIRLGMDLQNFWLDCAESNIAVQPISAALETSPFKEAITQDLQLTKSCQMIIRLGYVDKYGENQALRRNLEDYIILK